MNPRYHVGQKVIIKPLTLESGDPRHSVLNKYAGEVGTIADYYWIDTHLSGVFHTYKVKIGANDNEIVVHEDEIEEYVSPSVKS